MARPPEDVFRLLNRPAELGEVPFFIEHFGANARALRDAICSFAAALPAIERDVLLQCDVGGRAAEEVGKEIGLCRRQIQRRRKAVRRKFIEHILGNGTEASTLRFSPVSHRDTHLQRRAQIFAAALRGEPAKTTAARLGISVRTLWRERALMNRAEDGASESRDKERALSRLLAGLERAWFCEDYIACSAAAEAALAVSRGIRFDDSPSAAAALFRTYSLSELIERTVGSPVLADAFFAQARAMAAQCKLAPRDETFFRVRELRQYFRDPVGYRKAYEQMTNAGARLEHPLAVLSLAEIYDAWGLEEDLSRTLQQAAAADDPRAPRHDVARMRAATLAFSLRPRHENIARQCITDVRAWSPPMSRSAILADAYDAFLAGRAGDPSSAIARLRGCALHFRKLGLRTETATVLHLAARLLVEHSAPREACPLIEESLDAANGRSSAKLYADLLRFASIAMGGRQRRRVAKTFGDALWAGGERIPVRTRAV